MAHDASSPVPLGGAVAPGFDDIRAAFAANFAEWGELGAAVSVLRDDEVVADLWGGWADLDRAVPWRPDTLANAYSVGKGIVSALLLHLVDVGTIELDQPVADVWPEFAAHGKDGVTIRHALSHQAGVPAIRAPLTNDDLWDFDRMCSALAASEPWWRPGERHAYHTNTFGHLVGGILRRVTGELPGTVLRRFAAPLDADVWFGIDDADQGRCAEIHFDAPALDSLDPTAPGLDDDTRMTLLSYVNPPGYSSIGVVNTPEWRRAQIPSTNGQMSARGISRFYAAVLRGELVSPGLLAEASRPQSSGFCPTLGQETSFGLGFQFWTPDRPLGRSPASFGHFGTGGSLGFADPDTGIAFGYVMNHVIPRWQSPCNRALVDAVYAAL